MKAAELMIGDWVNYSILNLNAKVVSTLGNHTIGIQFVDNNNKVEAIHGLLEEVIRPIPLTEEILEKNGFRIQVTDDNSRWLWVTDNSWLAYSERHNYWYYEDMKITYVHQLQHLLRLCGIEKELVID